MREMEFTIEDTEALKPGMEVGVTEGVLPTSYYYTIEHALGMSANFKQAERLKTRRGIVKGERIKRNAAVSYCSIGI